MRNIRRQGQLWVFRVSGPDDGRRLEANLPVIVAALAAAAAFAFGWRPLAEAMGSPIGAGLALVALAAALLWAGYTVRNNWLESGRFAPYLVSIDRGMGRIAASERDGGRLLWGEPFGAAKLHIVKVARGSLPGSLVGGTTSALVYGDAPSTAPQPDVPRRDRTLLTTASEAELVALVSALSGEARFPTPRR
jgi:hypothetical protein